MNTLEIRNRLAKCGIPSDNLLIRPIIADHCIAVTGHVFEGGQKKHVLYLLWFPKDSQTGLYKDKFTYQKLDESTEWPAVIRKHKELPKMNDDDPVVIEIKTNYGNFYFSVAEDKVLPERPVFRKKQPANYPWRY